MTLQAATGGAPDARARRLWRSLVALATPLEDAGGPLEDAGPRLEEEGARPRKVVSVPGRCENLVVEFDEAYTAFVEGFEALPSESQMIAIQAVDAKLSSMVRAADESLWTDRARRQDPVWRDVRELASAAIRAFEWPGEA